MDADSLSLDVACGVAGRRVVCALALPCFTRVAVATLLAISLAALPAVAAVAGEDIFKDGFDPPPPAPINDTCETAQTLTPSSPTNGTTVGATNNYDSGLETQACTGFTQAGADVAYSIVLFSGQTVTVTLSAVYPTLDASIALLGPGTASVCNANPVTCLKGADTYGFGVGESFSYPVTQSGTYYVIVDSFYTGSGDTGPFTIEVTSP